MNAILEEQMPILSKQDANSFNWLDPRNARKIHSGDKVTTELLKFPSGTTECNE